MVLLGMNYRLPDINCALGLSQMKKLDQNLARRREIAAAYGARLAGLPGLILPTVRTEVNPAWHLYAVRVNAAQLIVGRAEVFRALRAENIGVYVYYIPFHLHPYYRERFGYKGGEFPVAETAYEQLLSLPMFPAMTNADVDDVVRAIGKVLEHYAG
jgi:dTDP-4-amino-4,6-dideoxygalactose transaminase